MHPVDRRILELCKSGFSRLKPLVEHYSQGSVYRHAKKLLQLGWLERRASYYRTTTEGLRQLEAAHSSRRWNLVEAAYPPLQKIPTSVHRALAELVLASVVCRQHGTREDRHPFFIAAGATFHWKTSLGEFLCQALGLDPGRHIVECGAETGQSLFVRRTGRGTFAYKRELLASPFLVLDDYHSADPAARRALQPLLSGRLSVPVENSQVTFRSVPLLTLNPAKHQELEKRLGLSTAHIRRAVIANLDAVPMPDLACSGGQAIESVKLEGPITLNTPQVDCLRHLQPTLKLLREMVLPEASERFDVQVLLNLSTGMTAFLSDAETAIAQVCYDFGILAETLGWVRPGWVQYVTDFSLSSKAARKLPSNGETRPASNASSQAEEPLAARKTLDLATPKIRRDSALPSLTLSNKLRTRLAWLEEETGRSTEEVFNFLIDHYISWRRDPAGLAALYKVLSLARSLEVDEIDVELVYRYLTTEQILQRLGCTIEDVPPAIRLLELLSNLPEVWSWDTAQSAIQSVAFLIQAGIDPKAVRSFLANHYVLSEKGLDVRLVRILDKAFTRAGLKGQRRDQASWELVKGVALKLSIDEMEVTKKNLKSEIRGYQDTLQQITAAIHEAKPRLSRLKEDKRKVTQHLDQLETEYQRKKGHIEVFEGFVCFLLGKLKADDPFWKTLEQLLQMRHQGKISDVQAREALTVTLVPQLLNFITYVGEQTQGGPNVLH